MPESNDLCPFCGGAGKAATFYGHRDYVTLKFQVAPKVVVWLCLSEPITQEAITKLIAMLEMQKDTFPRREELKASE